jgi:hypothetical protein
MLCYLGEHLTSPRSRIRVYRESPEVTQARRRARETPPAGRRLAWKTVTRLARKDRTAWEKLMVEHAVQGDWVARRTSLRARS